MAEVKPVRTVGDLIERLSNFDPDAFLGLRQALSPVADFVVVVGMVQGPDLRLLGWRPFGSPAVIVGDRSLPPALARMWHGCGHPQRLPAHGFGGSQLSQRVGGDDLIRSKIPVIQVSP